MRALDAFRDHERRLRALMEQKTTLEREVAVLRLDLQRRRNQRSPISDQTIAAIENELETKKSALAELDHSIAPLATADELRHVLGETRIAWETDYPAMRAVDPAMWWVPLVFALPVPILGLGI